MKLRCWMVLLMVMALLCGCAGAEGAFSGASHDAGLAVVGGEVYCAAPNVGLGFIPIWRVSTAGLEKVHSRIGGWNGLYALDGELLTIEPVLNIGEMLGSIPTSTYAVGRLAPTTGKKSNIASYTWNTEDGVCNVFAAQGRAYRDVREGDGHVLQRLDDGEWTTGAQWTGDHAWVFDRRSWEIVSTVSMTEYPLYAALVDGRLYVYCSYGDAGVEIIDLATDESVHYPLN